MAVAKIISSSSFGMAHVTVCLEEILECRDLWKLLVGAERLLNLRLTSDPRSDPPLGNEGVSSSGIICQLCVSPQSQPALPDVEQLQLSGLGSQEMQFVYSIGWRGYILHPSEIQTC